MIAKILSLAVLVAVASAAPQPVGTNKCTYGPSYWCANEANANECGALAVCQAQGLLQGAVPAPVARRSAPVIGGSKCTYGPSYWCASAANANECGMLALCQSQGLLTDVAAPSTTDSASSSSTQAPLGANKCTYGPSYWCANEANANECGALAVCQAQGLLQGVARRSAPILGTSKCTYGPSYWCASAANANECGMLALCQSQGLLTDVAAPSTTTDSASTTQAPVGGNKCTYGPAYWCANEANANECGALAVCQAQGLLTSKTRRRRAVVGDAKCTWGPSFWCSSVENANLCGALAHCQSQGLLLDAPNGIECSLCTFVLKEIESEIGTNSTEQEITQVVEEVCNILPSSLEADCKSLIEEYGPQIIQLLLQEADPTTICTDLGLCTSASVQRRSINNVGTNKCTYGPSYWCANVANANECGALAHCQSQGLLLTPNGIECSLCTFVLKEIESEIGTNSTEQEITQVVEEVCNILPSSLEADCKSLIEEYGPQIIQLLLQEADPTTICTDLGLCTASVQRRSAAGINNVGTNKCTYGPSYWCANVANANQCGALAHCQAMGMLPAN